MRRNQKGSALLWAITVIMILMITVAAALGISYSYYNRSVNNNSKRQAYLTAKGVIQNIVEKIELDNSDYIAMIPEEENQSTPLNIDIPEASNIGKVTEAKISRVAVDKDKDIQNYDIGYCGLCRADRDCECRYAAGKNRRFEKMAVVKIL